MSMSNSKLLAGSPRYPASLRRALWRKGLEENIIPPLGRYTRPAMRVAPYYEPFGIQFVWDLPYSVPAVARVTGDIALCRGFVENMLDFAHDDGPDKGMVPRSVSAEGHQAGQDGSQTPLLAWLARELHRMEPDDGFLRRVYPKLAAFVDWWQSPRRDVDGDGLSEFGGSTPMYVAFESGHDFSPERDLVMGEPTAPGEDGLVHEPIADVFLNSCLYVELDALADIAAVVDRPALGKWLWRRDELAARMNEAMWDEEIGGFFPVVRRDLCETQPRVYRHTPALLQPLWAGLATEAQAARTIDLLLSRPRQYPRWRGRMRIKLDPSSYCHYQVITDGLHPSRGNGRAAGGVWLTAGGLAATFGADRGPATAPFRRFGIEVDVAAVEHPGMHLAVEVEDGTGEVMRVVDTRVDGPGRFEGAVGVGQGGSPRALAWINGLRRVELIAPGVTVNSLDVFYNDVAQSGLLSPFGIKSAHPLDGKHPAPGAPTEFWSGTIWAPHQFHGCHALARYGHEDLARACARAFCDAAAVSYAGGGDAFEHLSHETGRGLGTSGYTWTAAVALMLMADFCDDDLDQKR